MDKKLYAQEHRALLIAKNADKDREINHLKAKLVEFTQVHHSSVAAQRYQYERHCYHIVIAILVVVLVAIIGSLLYANICQPW